MTTKDLAKRVAWTALFGFTASGVVGAWTGDTRFIGTAFVLLLTALISAMTATW